MGMKIEMRIRGERIRRVSMRMRMKIRIRIRGRRIVRMRVREYGEYMRVNGNGE